jgi:hypothetical protein
MAGGKRVKAGGKRVRVGGNRVKRGFLGMPGWVSDTMTAIGLSTVIYALVRYTFLGEIIERVYVNTFGLTPAEEIGRDLTLIGDEMASGIRQTARELDSL